MAQRWTELFTMGKGGTDKEAAEAGYKCGCRGRAGEQAQKGRRGCCCFWWGKAHVYVDSVTRTSLRSEAIGDATLSGTTISRAEETADYGNLVSLSSPIL